MAEIRPFEISTPIENNWSGVQKLARQIAKIAADLSFILKSITIEDNFFREIVTVDIGPGAEVKIPHKLKKIPKGYLILYDTSGALRAGPTPWTTKEIYIENGAAVTSSNAKIAILG